MIRIVEVGPRDGLQTRRHLATREKIAFVDALRRRSRRDRGLFVRLAEVVPQLADADEVFRPFAGRLAWLFRARTNERGSSARSRPARRRIAVFTPPPRRSIRRTSSLDRRVDRALPSGHRTRRERWGFNPRILSTAFHCPYEGPIAPKPCASSRLSS